jgi:hypothetical protein
MASIKLIANDKYHSRARRNFQQTAAHPHLSQRSSLLVLVDFVLAKRFLLLSQQAKEKEKLMNLLAIT